MWDTSWSRSRSSEPRFPPRVGRDFELQEARVIDARTRGFLSRAIAIGAGAAVTITRGYGLGDRQLSGHGSGLGRGRPVVRRIGDTLLRFSGKEHTMRAM